MQLDREPVAHATGIDLPPSGLWQFESFFAKTQDATTPVSLLYQPSKCLNNFFDHSRPVADRGLPEEFASWIPEAIRSILKPTPIGRVSQHDTGWSRKGTC